jgi:hypothetical protein
MSEYQPGLSVGVPRINVELSIDSSYPGVMVEVRGMMLVLIEYDIDSEKHLIHVWDKDSWNGGDEVYHQEIPDDWKEPIEE